VYLYLRGRRTASSITGKQEREEKKRRPALREHPIFGGQKEGFRKEKKRPKASGAEREGGGQRGKKVARQSRSSENEYFAGYDRGRKRVKGFGRRSRVTKAKDHLRTAVGVSLS